MAESQMRKGVLELMVLAILNRRPSYGGEILDTLTQAKGIEVSSGTLYPLLSRLHKNGVLETRWEESPIGPPRKIYSLTARGHEHLSSLHEDWTTMAAAVTTILEGENT